VVDYRKLFLVPTALAVVAMLLLLLFFKPPTDRPQETAPTSAPK
jgi:hypothetical protein